jgi:hypothetical protein
MFSQINLSYVRRFALLMAVVFLTVSPVRAAELALCAEVKIEILQEVTLERQGFEALMRITNSLDTFALEDITVTVNFTDANGSEVTATSNTEASDADFFIRSDGSHNVTSLLIGDDGAVLDGTISQATTSEIRWLIIPTGNAAGVTENGELFFVGATLSYTYGGEQETVQVSPDSIVVKPQPALTLDYFLTEEVIGDDAFTQEIEVPEPYTLGVRVSNNGFGSARNMAIESAQPQIVENELGLAVDFKITKSFLNDEVAEPTLLINFGDIESQKISSGRWLMETSLSGKFTAFNASFTHADELGGELTSLISDVDTHFLLRDVLVDAVGHDSISDFLARSPDGGLYVYESEVTGLDEALCQNCAAVTELSGSLGNDQAGTRVLTTTPHAGYGYYHLSDPYSGSQILTKIVRSDGKLLPLHNGWISKERDADKINFNTFINIFDLNPSDNYTLFFGSVTNTPQPPVIQVVNERTTFEGGQVGFLIQSSDPNGTTPTLSATQLPTGATFADEGNGVGVFSWFPAVGQAGSYTAKFQASDGELTSVRDVTIVVNPSDDQDGDGLTDAWEMQHFGNLDRDGNADFDSDGRTDQEEHDAGSDPTVPELAPDAPQVISPIFEAEVLDGATPPHLPTLEIENGAHSAEMEVMYRFEVYAD